MRKFDMKRDWDERAKENARKAIACEANSDEAVFQASGQRDAATILEGLESTTPRESLLEIGCGVGRLLEPLAGSFRHLYGVDVSWEMVRRGRQRLAHLPQVHFVEVNGDGILPFHPSAFDFCFSYITFHHIPQKEIVIRYIAEAYRVLKENGVFRFHLFGRPEGIAQALRERLTHKSTWRGCKFTLPEIRSITEQAGFEIIETRLTDPFPGQRRRFLGKMLPQMIWVTARRSATAPRNGPVARAV